MPRSAASRVTASRPQPLRRASGSPRARRPHRGIAAGPTCGTAPRPASDAGIARAARRRARNR
ncbi:hypothetical protein WS91_29410 [Burkholderia sp. MSMB1498]|nr:hypothetical protein WS91_29410 [Burkholderia sp. MSMB1498]